MEERPFTEVDNLIFSKLIYFDFDEVPLERPVTLREYFQRYQRLEEPKIYGSNSPVPLLEACARSERFGSTVIREFRAILDTERQTQFAAATFEMSEGSCYVAYRGTDSSLVGWREDFNLMYMEETPAQGEAVAYLERIMDEVPGRVLVGGHSKGGNLAVYAAAFCRKEYRDRIAAVYSNDGPGFNRHIGESPEYGEVLPKVRLIIPESSMIGIIFSYGMKKEIIKCSVDGAAQQHNPYTWLVERETFVRAGQQTYSSLFLDETLKKWFDSLDEENRRGFVSTIFDALDASGAATLEELNQKKWLSYNAILKATHTLSQDAKDNFRETLKKLALASRDVLWDETKKRLPPFKHKTEE